MNKYAHQRTDYNKSYNETALAITSDDGPLRPKHVVVE
jgi:hypothetical protein